MSNFDIKKTHRGAVPLLPLEKIATEILGTRYELSLVVCGDTLARRMNKKYRHKSYAPNVLAFPLGTHSSEIFLNVAKAKREARTMRVSLRARLAHLYVHGCFHLKGYKHGEKMERLEDRTLTKFKLV